MRWKKIDSAPQDGRKLRLKRVHQGRIVTDAVGYWGVRVPEAPLRQPTPAYLPGDKPTEPDLQYCDKPTWLTETGLYSFPTPTHWAEIEEAQSTTAPASKTELKALALKARWRINRARQELIAVEERGEGRERRDLARDAYKRALVENWLPIDAYLLAQADR